MKELLKYIEERLAEHFNQPVEITNCEQVFGGDINRTYKLQTNYQSFFLKLNEKSFDDMFEKEFEGLKLLHQTKSIKIPEPIFCGTFENQILLITEFIQKGNSSKNFWEIFGRQLVSLHKNTNNQFGLNTNNYIGSLHQQNNFSHSWAEFYASQRILPLAQQAFNQQKLTKAEIAETESLCMRLNDLFPEEKPALIHGDLWSGNFMSDESSKPVIYDPAIYFGNREMDIAMSLLFGGFNASFYDVYNEIFPLQKGWKERVALCQLYPLLVHLILFGGRYYGSVKSIVDHYK